MPLEAVDSPLVSLILSPASSTTPTPNNVEEHSLSAHAYLLSLTSHSLFDLRSQPAALSTAKSSLNTQLSSLCSQHVSSFAQVHQATSSLPSSLDALDAALQSLIETDLPTLSNVAQQFSQQIEAPLQAKEKAQNLLSQYDLMLKDLLDIPRLLMTCVRASHPVEALQLAVHMMKIVAQSEYNNVHKALQEECWTHLKRLREDLLRGLGARGLRLPAAKRLVSLLRKFREIDEAARGGQDDKDLVEKLSLSDSTICLSFLRSRWTLVEEVTSNASATKSTSILSMHLSTWRDVIGDTCGVAQALFFNSSADTPDEISPDTLVFLFSHHALSTLRHLLAEAVPSMREEAASLQENYEILAAIHTQLAYSAASLSRQGLEISQVVSGQDILALENVSLWKRALSEAKANFERGRVGKNASDCLSWFGREKLQVILSQELQSFSAPDRWSTQVKHLPDVTDFTNSLLRSYNALLSFAPETTGIQVIEALDSTFTQVLTALLKAMERNDHIDPTLPLPPILSSSMQSRYYENDMARQSEANLACLARVMTALCGGAMTYMRGLLVELYGDKGKEDFLLSSIRIKALDWAQRGEDLWIKSEKTRKERVRVEEENIAAEERRQREEERIRQEERERQKAEEATKRQEEEAERARQRLMQAKQQEEEEAERRRLAKIEEEKRLEEERAFVDAQRKEVEEGMRRPEEGEEAKRVILAEEQAERAEVAEEEMKTVKEAEEEAERVIAEEEAQTVTEAEEAAKKAREAEEGARRALEAKENAREAKAVEDKATGQQEGKEDSSLPEEVAAEETEKQEVGKDDTLEKDQDS